MLTFQLVTKSEEAISPTTGVFALLRLYHSLGDRP